MSFVDQLLAQSQGQSRQLTAPQPNNPFAAQPGFLGGFLESGLSAVPEFFGADPTNEAVTFRAQHPIAGFASQVLPTMVPYAGAFRFSKTALGAEALGAGMRGAKAVGTALGMNVVDRPVIAAAVKEMLRYSPVELGRLGVGLAINPDNAGELFGDVALSTAFAGGLGGFGGYLRVGGTSKRALGGSRIEGQNNMFAHPVVDLRAALQPEAKVAATEVGGDLAQEVSNLTAKVLNDAPIRGYISKKDVPLITAVEGGDDKTAQHINSMFKPNSATVKERALDRRKLWEGPADNATTLNAGELQPVAQQLGFQSPTELAENVLQGRLVTINSERAAGGMNKLVESPALIKYGEDVYATRTDTGSTVLFKRLPRAEEPSPGTIVSKAETPTPAAEAVDQADVARYQKLMQDLYKTESVHTRAGNGEKALEVRRQIEAARNHTFEPLQPIGNKARETKIGQIETQLSVWQKKRAQFEQLAQEKPSALVAVESDGVKVMPQQAIAEIDRRIVRDTADLERVRNAPQKISRPALAASAPKPPPKTGVFQTGDRWAVIHTDRPGAFVRDLEKLNAANKAQWETMRRMFQPMGHDPHVFNQADDILLRTVSPLDVARMSRQSRKTWVAETAKALGNRGLQSMGLNNSHALQSYADHLYDVFAPAMFKERRNSLYARYSGLLTNRLRTVNEKVNEAIFGREGLKEGARGTLGRNFERQQINGKMAFRETVAQLTDEELDTVVKALVTQTPAKEVAKLAADGQISEQAFKAVQRMQEINADFMHEVVLPSVKSLGEKGNFDLLEGYVIPRVLLGDWRVPVKTEGGHLVYLASGKSRKAAESTAKAIVEEAESRGVKYVADVPNLKHAVEMNVEDVTDIMEGMAKKLDSDPEALDIVQSAMKRVQYVNVKRQAKLPYRPRTPGSLANERSGLKATDTHYTRDEFIKAFEAHIRKMGNFAAVHSYMERWGNEVMALKGDNSVLYNDVMRRAQQAMGVEGQLTRVLNEKLSPVLGPQMGSKAATKIAAATNKTIYAWQLGFANPVFALLNALSPLQTVLPQLAFVMRAPATESNLLLHHVPLYGANGKPIGQGAFLDPMKVLWNAVRSLRHADEELQHIHVRLRNDNTLHPMLFEEHVGAGASNPQTLKESFQSGGWAQFLIDGSTVMARKSEEFARIVSANAGYLVGKHQLGLEGEQLYHFTKRFAESTNYLYGQSDRARIITGPVGSMFGLFKNWQMHFMGMMATYAGLGIKHNVWAPLVWQMAAAGTLGGLGATPLRHAADGLANWATDGDTKDGFLWMQEHWGRPWADMAFFGPMGALGVSLQASASIPGTDVRNDMQMITSSVVLERMKALGKTAGAAYEHYSVTGENPLQDANIRDQFLAAAAPRAISRAASVVEGEYVKSMGTGYPQLQDPSFTAKMLHGMGMNAVEIERHQVAARRLYNDQQERKANTSAAGKNYAAAIAAQDYDEADRVITASIARGLDVSSVMQSASNYRRREEGDLLDRYKGESAARYRAAVGQ